MCSVMLFVCLFSLLVYLIFVFFRLFVYCCLLLFCLFLLFLIIVVFCRLVTTYTFTLIYVLQTLLRLCGDGRRCGGLEKEDDSAARQPPVPHPAQREHRAVRRAVVAVG